MGSAGFTRVVWSVHGREWLVAAFAVNAQPPAAAVWR
jgi:hypothetical protein